MDDKPVLNFCNRNLGLHGGEVYRTFRTDARVIVDEPPYCTSNCNDCKHGPIAVYIPHWMDDVDADMPSELLKADTTVNLLKMIEEKLKGLEDKLPP